MESARSAVSSVDRRPFVSVTRKPAMLKPRLISSYISELMDILLACMDQLWADQPNSLEGLPLQSYRCEICHCPR
eukprot:1158630-Pelagomonas_calceolata.AAC.11